MMCHSDGQQDMFAAPAMRENPGRKPHAHHVVKIADGTVNSICQSCGNDCKQVYPARVVSCKQWRSIHG